MTVESKAGIDAENPWPGLSAFDEDAYTFFNGRDAETSELLRLIGAASLIVLFGRSGLGKTSLLKAGVFPKLRSQNLLPIYVRLDMRAPSPLIEQITAGLKTELVQRKIDGPLPSDGETLWQYLHRDKLQWWSPKNKQLTPLFILDQFEEAFTLGRENSDAIAKLKLALADLIENRIPPDVAARLDSDRLIERLNLRNQPYKVLLSFREDFLPEVESWKREIPSLMRNRLRLLPMSAIRAVEAVSGKSEKHELKTHELVDQNTAIDIVRFVAAAQSADEKTDREKAKRHAETDQWETLIIEPALLSLVCAGLNEERKTRRQSVISASLLQEIGNTIVTDFYGKALLGVPKKSRRFIENSLITEGGYRNSYPVRDAVQQGHLSEQLLQQLVDRRLLRVDHQMGSDRVELIHDLLTQAVRKDRNRSRDRRHKYAMAAVAGIALVFLFLAIGSLRSRNVAETARERAIDAEKLAVEANRKNEELLKKLQAVIAETDDPEIEQRLTAAIFPDSVKTLTPNQENQRVAEVAAPSNLERARGRNPPQYGLKLWANGSSLRVRFMDGTAKQQDLVRQTAVEWTKYANLHFEFGSAKDAEVRIKFDPSGGSWSFLGSESLPIPTNNPTMNLGFPDKQSILHEFGHVLGLIHESSNPNANIPWNKDVVYSEMQKTNLWDKATVDANIFALEKGVEYRPYDPDSIMMYAFAPSWFRDGKPRGGKQDLSESDKEFARKLYPPN